MMTASLREWAGLRNKKIQSFELKQFLTGTR